MQESITSTSEIVAFNKEIWDEKRLGRLFSDALKHRLRAIILEARYGGIQNLAAFVSPFLILAVGAPYIMRGELTVGNILAFQQWTMFPYSHARNLYNTNQLIQQVLGAAERVINFLDEEEDPPPSNRRSNFTRRVRRSFHERSFIFIRRCPDRFAQHLSRYRHRRTCGIGGPSGSGKTTLFLLLLPFFDPDEGRIRVDGIDYITLDASSLREHIGIVFQEPLLFNGSLYENIAFGRDEVQRRDVIRVAEMAEVASLVNELPDGYNTHFGERGVRPSGGQKQRIAIARALLRDPKILLLDEATSALDVEPEAEA